MNLSFFFLKIFIVSLCCLFCINVSAERHVYSCVSTSVSLVSVDGDGAVRLDFSDFSDCRNVSGESSFPPMCNDDQVSYGRFYFDGKTGAGKKMFALIASAKVAQFPITVWFSTPKDCDASMSNYYDRLAILYHAGFFDAALSP